MSNTVNESIKLFRDGKAIPEIAEVRSLSVNSIYQHLCVAIEHDIVALSEVILIDQDNIDEIIYALELADEAEEFSLKSVFESLDEAYDYNTIKCVKASLAGS